MNTAPQPDYDLTSIDFGGLRRVVRPEWFVRDSGADHAWGIHGVGHCARVMILSRTIAARNDFSPEESLALELAARWHDIGRRNDGADPGHGRRSCERARKWDLVGGHPAHVCDMALLAVRCHSLDDSVGEDLASRTTTPHSSLRVFHGLKDADGLDRVRLGDLRTSYLRFPTSCELEDYAHWLLGVVSNRNLMDAVG